MMQTAANEHWKQAALAVIDADKASVPDHPGDFGFLGDWQDALEMGDKFARYQILPHAGGWFDQLESDRHDINVYMRGLAYHTHVQYEIKRNASRRKKNSARSD